MEKSSLQIDKNETEKVTPKNNAEPSLNENGQQPTDESVLQRTPSLNVLFLCFFTNANSRLYADRRRNASEDEQQQESEAEGEERGTTGAQEGGRRLK